MTPGARVQAAIEILDLILGGQPAEKALTGWARRARFAGSKDRAAIRDHVFQALRCRRSFASFGGAETGRGLMIGAQRARGEEPDAVFTGIGHAPKPLSDEERAAGAPPESDGARLDLPDWMVPLFRDALGEDAERAAETLRTRAPVMLRVNLRKTDRGAAIAGLREDGITAVPAPVASTALLVTEGARRVATSRAYRDGLVELQDGASQAAVEALALPEGGRILDYCAGGGGKTLAMAARVDGAFFAHDAAAQRMSDLPDRARRAGIEVQIVDPGGCDTWAPFDLVLCDVPCSGSGTWRRTPDAKWRLSREALTALTTTQDGILEAAHNLVGPGGILAYSTCSLFRCENEDRVDAFLDRHPGWTRVASERWSVTPDQDGFFLSLLGRGAE